MYDKEMLIIIHPMTKWRPYLIEWHFQIRTNYHSSLKYILEQSISSMGQLNWVTKLLEYDYEIVYKKGANADQIKKEQQEDLE